MENNQINWKIIYFYELLNYFNIKINNVENNCNKKKNENFLQTNLVLIRNPHAIIAQYEKEIVIKNRSKQNAYL